MPVAIDSCEVTLSGSMAVASAIVVLTDAKGVEVARETITAEVNKDLRADDADRRGVKADARDRLAELLAEKADALDAAQAAKAVETDPFADLKDRASARLKNPAKTVAADKPEVR